MNASPVPQNILYCPFGLKCGHELCKICALRSAGFTASLGDPVKLLARAPVEAKCPECQLPGVFKGVIYLNQVDQMVKERKVLPTSFIIYWDNSLPPPPPPRGRPDLAIVIVNT